MDMKNDDKFIGKLGCYYKKMTLSLLK